MRFYKNEQPGSPGDGTPSSFRATPNQTVVEVIRALLGKDVVLIPVRRGLKQPLHGEWQKTTIGAMNDPVYLAGLERNDIGVLLGRASGNLCAIDIDDDAGVEPFLKLNPELARTLRTHGARGAQLWVRIEGDFPALTKIKTSGGGDWGEWRADGGQSVIHGFHPNGRPYTIQNRAAPVSLAFEKIIWPPDLKLPWVKTEYELLVEAEGEPFSIGKAGGVTINHMFFVRKYQLEHHVLYDSTLAEFFQYDEKSGLWLRQSEESLKRRFLDSLHQAAKETGVSAVQLKRTDAFAGSLVSLLKSIVEQPCGFDKRPTAVHVGNGMICFEEDTVSLRTFHPTYLSRNQCPHPFDPNAECPMFKEQLLRSALDDDDVLLIQKWAGSVLLGRNPAQRFLLMLGTAGGGKSTLMTVLEQVIGLNNVAQLRTEQLGERFELCGFVGKTLLTGKDVAPNFLMQKGAHVLKALVGHDLLEAEKKGLNDRVLLRGDFNVGITCNADLNIRLEGDSAAWRRRMLVIRYDRPAPAKRIVDLPNQLLQQEGSGILRWMIEGAIALLNDLDAHGDYVLTKTQQDRVDRLLEQSDSVKHFVKSGVTQKVGHDLTTQELHAAYYDFCEMNGWAPFPTSNVRATIADYMRDIHKVNPRHDIKRMDKSVRGYKNVAIKIDEEVAND